MSINDAISRIRSYFNRADFSRCEVARRAGLSGEAVIRRMHSPEWNPTLRIVTQLEAAIPDGWRDGDPVVGDSDVVERNSERRPRKRAGRNARRERGKARKASRDK